MVTFRSCAAASAAMGVVLTVSQPTSADVYSFNNPLGGNYLEPLNWSVGTVPGAGDLAMFNQSSANPYTVTFTASRINDQLVVRTDQVAFDLSTFTLTLNASDNGVYIGDTDFSNAQVSLTNGHLNADSIRMAGSASSTAKLDIGSGAVLNLHAVNGNGDSYGGLGVGIWGNADAVIHDTAVVTAFQVWLAEWPTSTATLSVRDGGQLINNFNAPLFVGTQGSGTLNVTAGGKVLTTWIIAAADSNGGLNTNLRGDILVDGVGSNLTVEHQIILGAQGPATMKISNKATASTGGFGGMMIGQDKNGDGTLRIETGGVLTSTDDSTIADVATSKGRVTVTGVGSKWDIHGSTLNVGPGGDAGDLLSNGSDAGLRVADGASVLVNQLPIGGLWIQDPNNYPLVGDPLPYTPHQGRGVVTVTGVNSDATLTSSSIQVMDTLIVGNGGKGQLFVLQGGQMETANLTAGVSLAWNDELGTAHPSYGTGDIVVGDTGSILRITSNGFAIGFDRGCTGSLTVQNSGNAASVDHVVGWYDTNGQPVTFDTPGAIAAWSSAWVTIGDRGGAIGTLNVNGAGSAFVNDHAPTIIGNFGAGYVNITAGGSLTNSGGEIWIGHEVESQGHVLVSGVGSRLHEVSDYPSTIGERGLGDLTVNAGASARFSHLVVGDFGTGQGTVAVQGVDALTTSNLNILTADGLAGDLTVGNGGTGTLNIHDYGQVQCVTFSMGRINQWTDTGGVNHTDHGTSLVNVAGPGATLSVTAGDLLVAVDDQSHATLNVSLGGSAAAPNGNLYVAMWPGSYGAVTVSGAGSQIIAPKDDYGSWVGRAGTGSLAISDNGFVKVSRLTVGEQPEGSGYVSVSTGGKLEAMHDIQVGNSGQGEIHLGGGTIQLDDHQQFLVVSQHGKLTGSGAITGGVVCETGGIISPGNSPGLVSVNYLELQSGGTLVFELAGLSRGSQFDAIDAWKYADEQYGNVILHDGSNIVLSFIEGFLPRTGDTFNLIAAQGGFTYNSGANVSILGIAPGWSYTLALVIPDETLGIDVLRLTSLSDATVPEPATFALLVVGATLLTGARRRSL